MIRGIAILSAIALIGLAGCKKPPSPKLLKSLKGGTTKVVVYGFCIPMDHLIKTAMTRRTLTFVVNGKKVGTMQTCSFATFRVPSGYWEAKFTGGSFFGHHLPGEIYRPGKTQYLHMYPSGNSTFTGRWVGKAEAKQGIAEIKQIGQLF